MHPSAPRRGWSHGGVKCVSWIPVERLVLDHIGMNLFGELLFAGNHLHSRRLDAGEAEPILAFDRVQRMHRLVTDFDVELKSREDPGTAGPPTPCLDDPWRKVTRDGFRPASSIAWKRASVRTPIRSTKLLKHLPPFSFHPIAKRSPTGVSAYKGSWAYILFSACPHLFL
jgi:hypothetical protein